MKTNLRYAKLWCHSFLSNLECHAGDARLAEGGDDVDAEEGHPAEQEGAHDDADGDGGLVVTDVVGAAGMSHPHGLVGRERSRYRPYVLHVFLCVTIQPANKGWKVVRTKTET